MSNMNNPAFRGLVQDDHDWVKQLEQCGDWVEEIIKQDDGVPNKSNDQSNNDYIESVILWKLQKVFGQFSPFRQRLTEEENSVIEKWSIDKFRKAAKEANTNLNHLGVPEVNLFIDDNTKHPWNSDWPIHFKHFVMLVDNGWVSDSILEVLHKTLLHDIKSITGLTEDMHFMPLLQTSKLDVKDNKLPEKAYDRSWIGFFGKDQKQKTMPKCADDNRIIFAPFHMNKNHYTFAIANVLQQTIYTCDHYGERASDKRMYKLFSELLNHNLKCHKKDIVEWKHVKLGNLVPRQYDSISCGFLRSLNGLLLSILPFKLAEPMFFTQEDIDCARPRLIYIILTKFRHLCASPEDAVQAAQRRLTAAKAAAAKAAAAKATAAKATAAKTAHKPNAAPTNHKAAPPKPPNQTDKERVLKEIRAMTIEDDLEREVSKQLFDSEIALFNVLRPGDSRIKDTISLHFENPHSDEAKKLAEGMKSYFHLFDCYVQQLCILRWLSYNVWPHITDVPGFPLASYFCNILQHVYQAESFLDTGKGLTKKDKGVLGGYWHEIFLQKNRGHLKKKYPNIILKPRRTKKKKTMSLQNWSDSIYDVVTACRALMKTIFNNINLNRTEISASLRKDAVIVMYGVLTRKSVRGHTISGLSEAQLNMPCTLRSLGALSWIRTHIIALLEMSTPTSVPHWLVPAIELIQQHVKPAVVVQLSPEPAKVKKAVRRRIVESESEEEENDCVLKEEEKNDNNNLLDLFDSAGKLTEESDTKVDEPGLDMLDDTVGNDDDVEAGDGEGGGGSAAGASASSKDKKSVTAANADVSKNDSPSKNTRGQKKLKKQIDDDAVGDDDEGGDGGKENDLNTAEDHDGNQHGNHYIFHQHQSLLYCGMCSVNGILQKEKYKPSDFNKIGVAIRNLELAILGGGFTEEQKTFLSNSTEWLDYEDRARTTQERKKKEQFILWVKEMQEVFKLKEGDQSFGCLDCPHQQDDEADEDFHRRMLKWYREQLKMITVDMYEGEDADFTRYGDYSIQVIDKAIRDNDLLLEPYDGFDSKLSPTSEPKDGVFLVCIDGSHYYSGRFQYGQFWHLDTLNKKPKLSTWDDFKLNYQCGESYTVWQLQTKDKKIYTAVPSPPVSADKDDNWHNVADLMKPGGDKDPPRSSARLSARLRDKETPTKTKGKTPTKTSAKSGGEKNSSSSSNQRKTQTNGNPRKLPLARDMTPTTPTKTKGKTPTKTSATSCGKKNSSKKKTPRKAKSTKTKAKSSEKKKTSSEKKKKKKTPTVERKDDHPVSLAEVSRNSERTDQQLLQVDNMLPSTILGFLEEKKGVEQLTVVSEDGVTYEAGSHGGEIKVSYAMAEEEDNADEAIRIAEPSVLETADMPIAFRLPSRETTNQEEENHPPVALKSSLVRLARVWCDMNVLRDDCLARNSIILHQHQFLAENDSVTLLQMSKRTSKIMLRKTMPGSSKNHDLWEILEGQLDKSRYDALHNVVNEAVENRQELAMIGFCSIWGDTKIVDHLRFNAFLVFVQPSPNDNDIDIRFSWKSTLFQDQCLSRLIQIISFVFWGDFQERSVTYHPTQGAERHEDGRLPLPVSTGWGKGESNLSVIRDRLGNDNVMKVDDKKLMAAEKSTKKLLDEAFGSDDYIKTHWDHFPLNVFTHYLSSEKQFITELAAEILQDVHVLRFTTHEGLYIAEFFCTCCEQRIARANTNNLKDIGYVLLVHYFGESYYLLDEDDVQIYNWAGFHSKNCHVHPVGITKCRSNACKRMNLYDAAAMDAACTSLKDRRCNTMALMAVLFGEGDKSFFFQATKSSVPRDNTEAPDAISLLINTTKIPVSMMNCVKRPVQIKCDLTDLGVDPISNIKVDPSWTINDGKDVEMPSKIGVIRNIPHDGIHVGRRVIHDGSHIRCTDMEDSQKNDVGNMLCYYFARCIVRIDQGMTFDELKTSIKGFRLPDELKRLMGSNEFDRDLLVVLTDSSDKKKAKKLRMTITDRMRSEIAMFVPSEFFLRLFPKQEILKLLDRGKRNVYDIPTSVHAKLSKPILRSLDLEIAEIKLYSLAPNWIVQVGTTDRKKLYADGRSFFNTCPIEPWVLDRLKRLNFVGAKDCITIGEGKRSVFTDKRVIDSMSTRNFWHDALNHHNVCAPGAMANFLAAAGQDSIAKELKSKTLEMLRNNSSSDQLLHIVWEVLHKHGIGKQLFKVNETKALSLDSAIQVAERLQTPCLFLFKASSNFYQHAFVIWNNLVFDVQDESYYKCNVQVLKEKMNADQDLLSLQSVYCLHTRHRRWNIERFRYDETGLGPIRLEDFPSTYRRNVFIEVKPPMSNSSKKRKKNKQQKAKKKMKYIQNADK